MKSNEKPVCVQVQVTDPDTGDVETVELRNNYVVIVDGSCYVAHTQVLGNGTHVLRIKGCWS